MSEQTSEVGSVPGRARPATGGAPRPAVFVTRARLARELRQAALPLAVIAMFVYFSFASDVFLTVPNFQNVGLSAAALAVVAFGQCFVVLTAGIDLSVGSTVALVSVVSAMTMRDHGTAAGLAAGLGAGLAVGLVNGIVVTRLHVVPFAATLAMLSIASSLALSLSGGTPVVGIPDRFASIAQQQVFSVPTPVLIAAATFAAAYVLLRFTRLGRHIYATGGNLEAARLSGIRVQLVTATTYVLCSLFAAGGALILTARVASGQPTLGASLALESVAAVVLGGVSLFGGRGSVLGVLFGVIFVSVLANGLNLVGVSSYTQMFVLGVALITVLALDWRLGRHEASA